MQSKNLGMSEGRVAPAPEGECDVLLPEGAASPPKPRAGRAGPWLFSVTLIAVISFFWWLTIYSHGVAPHAF